MLALSEFRRDINGIIIGQWRLYHRDKAFSMDLGGATFYEGVTLRPVGGAVLQRIVAAMGELIDRAEPWTVEPETRRAPVIPDVPPAMSIAKSLQIQESVIRDDSDDGYNTADKEQLYAIAVAKSLHPDKRWGAPRLRQYLRDAENGR